MDGRGEGSVLLDSSSTRAMLREVLGGWGLGFAVSGSADSLRFSHTGATEGYRAISMGWASRGQGVVIMTNSDTGGQLYSGAGRCSGDDHPDRLEFVHPALLVVGRRCGA